MPIAVFYDANGAVSHVVKTDGPNAEADLAAHTKAPAPGLTVLRLEDAAYKDMGHAEFMAEIMKTTGKPIPKSVTDPLPPKPAEPPAAAQARSAAVAASIAAGKSYSQVMAAGEAAARVAMADVGAVVDL